MFTFLSAFFRDVSLAETGVFGARAGEALFRIFPFRKKIIRENIDHFLVWAGRGQMDTDSLILENYRHMGMMFFENFWLRNFRKETYTHSVQTDFPPDLETGLKSGVPAVILIGHLGNWELLVAGMPLLTGHPVTFISKKIKNRSVNWFMHALREQNLNRMVPTAMAREVINQELAAGKPIGLAADQSAPLKSYWSYFLGRPVPIFLGPASFALKHRVPIFFLAPIRTAPGEFTIKGEIIRTDDLNPADRESLYILTERHTRILETYINKFPEQYYWIHKRWKHSEKASDYLPAYTAFHTTGY
ncbi:MAG: lysophospholipid acyltransferase family protein [Bacteroidetes bacterium]|nr:lysophospholipid acyltransferase family protein [Bacteroidota bacterium]